MEDESDDDVEVKIDSLDLIINKFAEAPNSNCNLNKSQELTKMNPLFTAQSSTDKAPKELFPPLFHNFEQPKAKPTQLRMGRKRKQPCQSEAEENVG